MTPFRKVRCTDICRVRRVVFYWLVVAQDKGAPVTVAAGQWPEKELVNLWTTEESLSSPQPHPQPPRPLSPRQFGYCFPIKETHGVIHHHFVLAKLPHDEEASLDVVKCTRRTPLALKTPCSCPHALTKGCGAAAAPQGLPTLHQVQGTHS